VTSLATRRPGSRRQATSRPTLASPNSSTALRRRRRLVQTMHTPLSRDYSSFFLTYLFSLFFAFASNMAIGQQFYGAGPAQVVCRSDPFDFPSPPPAHLFSFSFAVDTAAAAVLSARLCTALRCPPALRRACAATSKPFLLAAFSVLSGAANVRSVFPFQYGSYPPPGPPMY
jgi:hypothetical protein